MRFARTAMCAGSLGLSVTCLAGCGSGTLLSRSQAGELKHQLAQITQSLNARQCQQAATQIDTFRVTVNGLGSVDAGLISNLDQGAAAIERLAAKDCPVPATTIPKTTPATTPTPTTTTTKTTPTTTTKTTPTTTPTTPTTTTTTTTPTTPTTTTTTGPGSGGAGLGGGSGSGSGGGGG